MHEGCRFVQERGLEPPPPLRDWDLNPARLPIPPLLRANRYHSKVSLCTNNGQGKSWSGFLETTQLFVVEVKDL